MKFNLRGKTAIVTGSSKGIGFEIARNLYSEGCNIVLNSRNSEELNRIIHKFPGAIAIDADVSDSTQAKKVILETVKKFGSLDIVVCNVGGGQSVSPGNENLEEWKRVFALNLWSATNIVEASRYELAVNKGAIVCISSICGLEIVEEAPITYSVAKAALNAYVRCISRPLGKDGIRINAIALGNILFKESVWEKKRIKDEEAVNNFIKKNIALNRFGEPEDVANLVTYLVSDCARFATGGIWTLDGGQTH